MLLRECQAHTFFSQCISRRAGDEELTTRRLYLSRNYYEDFQVAIDLTCSR